MLIRQLWPAVLAFQAVLADSTTLLSGTATTPSSSETDTLISGTLTTETTGKLTGDNVLPTGVTYATLSTTLTLTTSSTAIPTGSSNSSSTGTGSTTKSSVTLLVGGTASTSNSTASSTSSSARPSNTQACNGYAEFCTRSYSNITMVTAHNSPFVRKGNAAANQALSVTDQLNDGIRMGMQSHPTNPVSHANTFPSQCKVKHIT
jgi:hypothetical protein